MFVCIDWLMALIHQRLFPFAVHFHPGWNRYGSYRKCKSIEKVLAEGMKTSYFYTVVREDKAQFTNKSLDMSVLFSTLRNYEAPIKYGSIACRQPTQ